jgi:hypothetical protein
MAIWLTSLRSTIGASGEPPIPGVWAKKLRGQLAPPDQRLGL